MAKVFLISDGRTKQAPDGKHIPGVQHDFSPANIYGEIEVLLPGNYDAMATRPLLTILRSKLRNFCDDDFILPSGSPILSMAACMQAARFNRGKVKVLKWDKTEKKYYPIQLEDA